MFITVTHSATTRKESACRIICRLCQQTSPNRWFANASMTSYYDVANSAHPVTMNTICCCSILEFGREQSYKEPVHQQQPVSSLYPKKDEKTEIAGLVSEEDSINEKSPNVRIIFKDSKVFQKTFNVATVHNLIFLGEIWQEFFMTFPVKGDESRGTARIFLRGGG